MPLNEKTKPTLMSLVEVSNYKNTAVVKHYGNMNMATAINSTTKSVGILSKTEEDKVKLCISNMFIGTSMYFDKVLTANQANVIAEEVLAKYEYRQLKLEDILCICIEIKESDSYKLTPARILKHIKDYYSRREHEVIHTSIQQSQNHKGSFGSLNIDDRVKNTIRHIERSNQEVAKGRVRVGKFYK